MSRILRKNLFSEGHSPTYFPTLAKVRQFLSNENMEDVIQREIQQYAKEFSQRNGPDSPFHGLIEKNPELALVYYLGNFHIQVPYRGNDRIKTFPKALSDKTTRQLMEGHDCSGHTRAYLRQTCPEYFQTIADVTHRVCPDLDRVSDISELGRKSPDGLPDELRIERAKLLLPIYVELRKMGYNKHDLT